MSEFGSAPGRHTSEGWVGDASFFRLVECPVEDLPHVVERVFRGNLLGAVARSAVDSDECKVVAERFWESEERSARVEGAPGFHLGAFHYGKNPADYVRESLGMQHALENVLGREDPLGQQMQRLAAYFAMRGITFRLAKYQGIDASKCLVRSWTGSGDYVLVPHEDLSQCTDPKQQDFEISRVRDGLVCSFNLSLEHTAGGELVLWNIQPSLHCRRDFGTEHTGIPYPDDFVANFEMLSFAPRAGDLYVFNGANIHGVRSLGGVGERRVTAACLAAFIDERTIVSWT